MTDSASSPARVAGASSANAASPSGGGAAPSVPAETPTLGLPWIAGGFVAAFVAGLGVLPSAALAGAMILGPWFACGALAVRAALRLRRGRDASLGFRGRRLLGPVPALVVPAALFGATFVFRETSLLKADLRRIEHRTSTISRVEEEMIAFPEPAGVRLDLSRFGLADLLSERFSPALPAGVSITGWIVGDGPSAYTPLWKSLDFAYEGELRVRGPRRAFQAPKSARPLAGGAPYAPEGPPDEYVERRLSLRGERVGSATGVSSRRGARLHCADAAADHLRKILAANLAF